MKFGNFDLFQLNNGLFQLTDTFVEEFAGDGLVTATVSSQAPLRLLIGLNVVVIRIAQQVVLCDTGIGAKYRHQPCNYPTPTGSAVPIHEQLKKLQIQPAEITHILLTHLHYDHAGGLTCFDQSGNLILTYPQAQVFVQAAEWEAAQQTIGKDSRGYHADDRSLLTDSPNLNLLNDNETILPGISVMRTNGHTRGHQIIQIDAGTGQTAVVLGDLIPTPSFFAHDLNFKYDYDAQQSQIRRKEIIEQALQEDWLLFFYHAPHVTAGRGQRQSDHSLRVKKIIADDLLLKYTE